jgi:hypothetical protein
MRPVRTSYGSGVRLSARVFLMAVPLMLALAPGAFAQSATATCTTYDSSNAPSSAFKGGDGIVVRGTGFGPSSLVLVSLQQGTRTVELARVGANDLGAFTLTGGVIPETVASGKAAIRAIDARGSATCPVTLTAGAGAEKSGMGGLYAVWGLLLAAFGAFLAVLTYRRWKTERLSEAVDRLTSGEISGTDPLPLLPPEHSTGLSWDPDEADRPVLEPPYPAREPAVNQAEPADVYATDPEAQWMPRAEDEDARFEEPKPSTQPSDAIERLRREVQTWKQ